MEITANELNKTVLKEGICSGCGICSIGKNSPYEMRLTKQGSYMPNIVDNTKLEEKVICPFSNNEINEDKISELLYKPLDNNLKHNENFGYYDKLYAGHVQKEDFRTNGSSGGSVSWICDELLRLNIVDVVIHVKETNKKSSDVSYEYIISETRKELREGAKSRYYPVKMDEVLNIVKKYNKRYVIVGVPCFIKGVNMLKISNPIYKQRILYTISIVCGHLKTTHYKDMLVSQIEKKKIKIKSFDFRHKLENRKASDYGTSLISRSKLKVKLNRKLFGTNWGMNLFKLKACDYCDDVVGETADISFGDAWLPNYIDESMGTNIVIVRNKIFSEIIEKSISNKDINFNELSEREIYQSQAGGFRHKRQGLSHRLYLDKKNNKWVPIKRVKPEKLSDQNRAALIENRLKLRDLSYYSENYKNIKKLKKELKTNIEINNKLLGISRFRAFLSSVRRFLIRI